MSLCPLHPDSFPDAGLFCFRKVTEKKQIPFDGASLFLQGAEGDSARCLSFQACMRCAISFFMIDLNGQGFFLTAVFCGFYKVIPEKFPIFVH